MPTELQFRVLRLLEFNPHLSQRELSKSLGVSLGGVNYCLSALAAKGSIKIQNFRSNQNKWVYAYLLTSQGLAEKTALTGSFLKRKMQEYQVLKAEIESLSHDVANQKAIQGAEDIVLKVESTVGIKSKNVSNVGYIKFKKAL